MTVTARGAAVETIFEQSRAVEPRGDGITGAHANYLLGKDPAQWRTGAPVFQRAIYRELYAGIDLVFYGSAGSLEYDFVVRPGADPRQIAMRVKGARSIRVTADGALELATPGGSIRWNRPVIYQVRGGVRQPVEGRFVRRGDRIAFVLGRYDRRRELVIDPTLVYASYLGGSDNEGERGMAVDSSGNFYITGFTFSQDLPHTGGSLQPAFHGGTAFAEIGGDAFVAKFTPSGALVYVTYLGGKSDDSGVAIAADASGNAYVAGFTSSSDFPTTHGAFQTTYAGGGNDRNLGISFGDAFVAKLNSSGTALLYSTYLGGSADDKASAIALDSAGNAYIGGATQSTNFPTRSPWQSSYKGAGGIPDLCSVCGPLENSGDGFIAKLKSDGSDLVYSTYVGGSQDDAVTAIAVDSAGNAYAGGVTLSKDFPTMGAFQNTFGGAASIDAQPVILIGDGFVAKVDSTGKPAYSTYLGGSADDGVMGIAVDSAGSAYVTGFTSSSNFPVTSGAAQKAFKGPATITGLRGFVWGDGFVAKLAPSGSSLVYSTYLGGSGDDAGMAIALDGANNAYVGGFSWSSKDFPISADALQKTWGGTQSDFSDPTGDGFLTKVSPDGSSFAYSSYYGGSADEAVTGVGLDSQGNVYLAGVTTSANLPSTANAAQPKFAGEDPQLQTETLGDSFVAVFSGLGSAAVPTITGVVNSLSSATTIAPGMPVTIFGSNLPSSASGGATVNGTAVTVLFASATQWSILIPAGTPVGSATIQVGSSAPVTVTLSQYAPALAGTGSNPATVNATHASGSAISTASPAVPGETITIYAAGLGPLDQNNNVIATVTVTIGGVNAPVSSAAAAPSATPGVETVAVTVPAGLAAGNQPVVLSVGGAHSQSLPLPVAATPAGPVITAVENGASFQPGVGSNAWITIAGVNLAAQSDTWNSLVASGQLPTALDGVTVTVGGQPAYVQYISATQINAVAPNVGAGTVAVTVKNSLGTSASFNATMGVESPAFFLWPGSYAVATRQDYSLAVKNGTFSGVTTIAAKPGDVIILWGSGFGPSSPAAPVGAVVPGDQTYYSANAVTVTLTPVGGGAAVPATVYGAALAQSYAALYQVAIQIPSSLAAGDYSIVATVGGVQSPASALITVQP